jgi:hypothetical protein
MDMEFRQRQTSDSAYSQAELVSNRSHHVHIPPAELPAELPEIEFPALNKYRQQEVITQCHPRIEPRNRSVETRTRSPRRQPGSRKVPEKEEATESEQYTVAAPQARGQRNPRSPATRNVIRKRTGSRDKEGDSSRVRSRSRPARQRGDNDRTPFSYPAEPVTSSSRTTNEHEACARNNATLRRQKDSTVRATDAAIYESFSRTREPEYPVYSNDLRTTHPSPASVQRQQRGGESSNSHPRHVPHARPFAPSEASSVSSGQGDSTASGVASTSDDTDSTPRRQRPELSMRHMASVMFNEDDQSRVSGASSLGRRR